jgi:hypothetical protein
VRPTSAACRARRSCTIASNAFGASLFAHTDDNDRRVADALAELSERRGVE